MGRIKALLFDMDGVISKTEEHHTKAFILALKEKGVKLTKKQLYKKGYERGKLSSEICKDLVKNLRLKISPAKLCKIKTAKTIKILNTAKIPQITGVVEFIKKASKKYKLGISTQSLSKEVEPVLQQLKIKKYFTRIVTSRDVKKRKPNPQSYLLLAKKFGILPAECIVFEDSKVGATAGKRAGMTVIGVLSSLTKKEFRIADYHIKNFKVSKLKKILEKKFT